MERPTIVTNEASRLAESSPHHHPKDDDTVYRQVHLSLTALAEDTRLRTRSNYFSLCRGLSSSSRYLNSGKGYFEHKNYYNRCGRRSQVRLTSEKKFIETLLKSRYTHRQMGGESTYKSVSKRETHREINFHFQADRSKCGRLVTDQEANHLAGASNDPHDAEVQLLASFASCCYSAIMARMGLIVSKVAIIAQDPCLHKGLWLYEQSIVKSCYLA